MQIPEIIADKFYRDFEEGLYDFIFTYKTDNPIKNKTIMQLCEECYCSAYNVTYEEFINETGITYNEVFCRAADMTEEVIEIMLKRFAEKEKPITDEECFRRAHKIMGTWSSYEFSEWKATGKVPDNG